MSQHVPAIAERVVGTVVVDGGHTSEDQLLGEARGSFAAGPS